MPLNSDPSWAILRSGNYRFFRKWPHPTILRPIFRICSIHASGSVMLAAERIFMIKDAKSASDAKLALPADNTLPDTKGTL